MSSTGVLTRADWGPRTHSHCEDWDFKWRQTAPRPCKSPKDSLASLGDSGFGNVSSALNDLAGLEVGWR